jgi:hypothetical protein
MNYRSLLLAFPGFALGATLLRAAEVPIANFDSDDVTAWSWESWSAPGELSHDASVNSGAGTPAGSLKLVNNFENQPGAYQQCVFTLNLGQNVDASALYTHVNLDVKVEAGSTPRAAGDFGTLEVIFRNGGDWTWNSLIGVPLTNTGWVRISAPVRAPAGEVHHLTIKLGQNALLGPVTYHIDNLTWTESSTPPPPPTMSIKPARAGLNLVAGTPGQYDRQSIRALDTSYSWVGASAPVSFAVTIADYPAASFSGFQTHVYLVPGTPGNEASPDWNQPTVAMLVILNNASGGATATFRWKENAPNSNGTYFEGEKPSVTSKTVVGTWNLSFTPNSVATLTAPDGTSTNFTVAASLASQLSGELRPYFGIQPNQTASIGQGVVVSKVKITSGSTVLLEDNFTGLELDPGKWEVIATSATSVKILTPESTGYWVGWTLPDTGFVLQSSGAVSSPTWADVVMENPVGTSFKLLHVPKANLPTAGSGFFRLRKP